MHPHPLFAALISFANGYPHPCPPCLRVATWNECPSEATGNQLPNCRSFSFGVGEQCEGDGECGTSRTENNCNGNQDVYVRCESNIPDPPRPPPGPSPTPTPIHSPPPPFPPFAPLPACSATAVCSIPKKAIGNQAERLHFIYYNIHVDRKRLRGRRLYNVLGVLGLL